MQESVRGYYVRARIPRDPSRIRELALYATLRASAIRRTLEKFSAEEAGRLTRERFGPGDARRKGLVGPVAQESSQKGFDGSRTPKSGRKALEGFEARGEGRNTQNGTETQEEGPNTQYRPQAVEAERSTLDRPERREASPEKRANQAEVKQDEQEKANNQKRGAPLVELQDLREKVREGWGNRLVVFLVDASDSMDVSQQLAAAKGAVLLLLSSAYVRRDRVSLIAFQGERAQVILPPTTSIHLARQKLAYLIPGGATPFADGLYTSWKLIRTERIKNPKRRIVLVILSDGEGNVPLVPGTDRDRELAALAELIRKERIHVVFVDTHPEGKVTDRPKQLATTLGAELQRLKRLESHDLLTLVETDRTWEKK